mmetsp:Transcript_66196/g.137934  ORF Transcript_66196/g.137934 Transcript_66196/m.137934 type:complete len:243 (-) Transcript_66196:566-1294(-)
MLSNIGYLRKDSGSTFLIPGTSHAATTASNSRNSFFAPTTMPWTRVGSPVLSSISCAMSLTGVDRLILTPLSSRYLIIGSCRPVCGLPSSILNTLASVRMANSMKMVSIALAEMLSQSKNPSAYAMGSHILSRLPRLPPNLRNHSEKDMSSRSLTMSMPPLKSTNARTIGDVPNRNAFATLSETPNCSVLAKACKPETGAPIGNLKSKAPNLPPSLTNVCTCSLILNTSSNLPVRFMIPNKL